MCKFPHLTNTVFKKLTERWAFFIPCIVCFNTKFVLDNAAFAHSLICTFSNYLTVTLLSDLGTRDASVTVAKAILMRYAPASAIVDISHNVAQYDLQQAAYLLVAAYKHFPAGTVHILPIDVFSGDAPCLLLAKKNGHYFIAPDNGLLSLAFGSEIENNLRCFEFSRPHHFSDWINSAGKVVESLQQESLSAYSSCEVKVAHRLLQPQLVPLGIDCNIRCIDHYGNVVLDITRPQFDEYVQARPFKIRIMRMEDVTTVSNNYNDVPDGMALCRFNDSGYLEIALNHKSAAAQLGLTSENADALGYRTIRVFF